MQTDRASASAFVVDPVKNFPISSLINGQNLVFLSHLQCVHVGGPKHLGETGALSLWIGDVSDTQKTYVCYLTKFRRLGIVSE